MFNLVYSLADNAPIKDGESAYARRLLTFFRPLYNIIYSLTIQGGWAVILLHLFRSWLAESSLCTSEERKLPCHDSLSLSRQVLELSLTLRDSVLESHAYIAQIPS